MELRQVPGVLVAAVTAVMRQLEAMALQIAAAAVVVVVNLMEVSSTVEMGDLELFT
jgi:hypothetical protein